MKKFPKIFMFVFVIFNLQNITAQSTLPNACNAICLDAVTSPSQVRTPQKVKGIAVCNMLPADTSVWWVFRPSGTTFNFSWSTTGCTCPTGGIAGADVVVYRGTTCNALTKIQCKNGVSGSFALTGLSPCYSYWIQVGSTNTCQCNVSLTYSVTQLLKTIEPVKISGPKTVCIGASAFFSATSTISCMNTNVFRWSLAQGSAQVFDQGNGTAEVIFTKGGKCRITVEPNFALCQPTFTKSYIDIEVIDLKEASENIKYCAEEVAYYVDLKTIIKKTNPTFNKEIVPNSYEVREPAGTKKTITVPYTVVGTNCSQVVKLNVDIPLVKKSILPSRLIAEGEKITIKEQTFSCADARPYPITFVKEGNIKGVCDSLFGISIQCIKVGTSIFPKAALLDCVNKSITLDASKTGTLPAALPIGNGNTGIRTYLWSNGATTSKINVSQAGTYTVTVSYTYKWISPTGTITRTIAKSVSALVVGSINNKPITPLPKTEYLTPCIGDTILYYQTTIANVTYSWSATNGIIIGKTTADSIRVIWGNQNPKQLCCRLNANCGIGNDTCFTVINSTVVPLPPKVILNECIATNTFRYAVATQADVSHHWVAKNGLLSKSIGDTVVVSWSSVGDKSLCVTSVADCTVSKDTCLVQGSAFIGNAGTFKVENLHSKDVFEMKVLPNPARESIDIWSNRKIDRYMVFDLTGRLLLETREANINISHLENGMYIIKGIDSSKEIKVLSFLKI